MVNGMDGPSGPSDSFQHSGLDQSQLDDIGYAKGDLDRPAEEIPPDEVLDSIEGALQSRELNLVEENETERLRAEERTEILQRAAKNKPQDPIATNDRHEYPVIDIAKRYYTKDSETGFDDRAVGRIMMLFDSRFPSNGDLVLLAEAIERDYQAEEAAAALAAYKEAEQIAQDYYDLHQDNEVPVVKTEEERLFDKANQLKARYDKIIAFKNALGELLRRIAKSRSEA